jgi:hypothetical protein
MAGTGTQDLISPGYVPAKRVRSRTHIADVHVKILLEICLRA